MFLTQHLLNGGQLLNDLLPVALNIAALAVLLLCLGQPLQALVVSVLVGLVGRVGLLTFLQDLPDGGLDGVVPGVHLLHVHRDLGFTAECRDIGTILGQFLNLSLTLLQSKQKGLKKERFS